MSRPRPSPSPQVEVASDIPYAVDGGRRRPAADEPVAAEIEPVAAEEPDGDAEIAARLAAWSAAAVVMDAARGRREPSITEKGAAQTGGLLRRFRAGQNLDAELEDYERQQAATPPVADELEPEVGRRG